MNENLRYLCLDIVLKSSASIASEGDLNWRWLDTRREEAFPAVREHTNYHSGQHQIWKTDNCKEAFSNSQKLPKNNRHEDEHLSAFQTFSRIKRIPALAENMFTLIRPGYKE